MTAGDKDSSRSKARDPRADPRKAPGAEAADLVAEVLKDAKERDEAARRREETPIGRTRQKVVAVSLPLAGAFSFYLWFGNPSWVTPTLPDPVTAEAAESGLRVAMFFEAQKIEDFRRQSGRLPDSLAELGATPAEMSYRRIDAQTYQLVGQSRGVTLTFNSDQAIQEFVGDAMDRLGIGQVR